MVSIIGVPTGNIIGDTILLMMPPTSSRAEQSISSYKVRIHRYITAIVSNKKKISTKGQLPV